MNGICGFLGPGDAALLPSLLDPVREPGSLEQIHTGPGFGLAQCWPASVPIASEGERPRNIHQAPDGVLVACHGELLPRTPNPAAALDQAWRRRSLESLDGSFAAARVDVRQRELTLLLDPFGAEALFFVRHQGVLWFASELKQLVMLPELPIAPNPRALHTYLTFSFVPAEMTPIAGIERVLPGHALVAREGFVSSQRWFALHEEVDAALAEPRAAARAVRGAVRRAVKKRLVANQRTGVYLSGGLDSSAVACLLRQAGADVRAFSLDFGAHSVEREHADQVARHLGVPLTWVPVSGRELLPVFDRLAYQLDLPFGDAVTGPQYLLGTAARAAGIESVFNGEGGDQFFGGWTSKPMVAARLYEGLLAHETPEEQYLRAYHRFYGLEEQLYTAEFKAAVGGPGQRRALLAPHLDEHGMHGFLNRVRLTDVALKGSYNILPRAARIAGGLGLALHMPLFDRELAELSFRLPPELKLHGASEKYVLKLAFSAALPREVVWRRKFGMSVPITDWLIGPRGARGPAPLAELLEELLGSASLGRRGYFNSGYVAALAAGEDQPSETRRRRIGEKLWALLMLEAWLRRFVDARGRRP